MLRTSPICAGVPVSAVRHLTWNYTSHKVNPHDSVASSSIPFCALSVTLFMALQLICTFRHSFQMQSITMCLCLLPSLLKKYMFVLTYTVCTLYSRYFSSGKLFVDAKNSGYFAVKICGSCMPEGY